MKEQIPTKQTLPGFLNVYINCVALKKEKFKKQR